MKPRKPRQEHSLPVLIVQHSPSEQPALFDRILESQAVRRVLIHPYLGDSFPDPNEVAGVVSLGGPMSAFEEEAHPWISAECAFLRAAHLREIPILGICLGGQLLAKAMGGHVERAKQPEMGWIPIEISHEGRSDAVFGTVYSLFGPQLLVYHWHQDMFHLPNKAVLLAKTAECAHQAYRLGKNAYGLQFHPEVDLHLMTQWLAEPGSEEEILAAQNAHPHAEIQSIQTQKHHATHGEALSATLTATLGTLFRPKQRETKPSLDSTQLKDWMEKETLLCVEFQGVDVPRSLDGKIIKTIETALGSFILFRTRELSLWPIRYDDITQISSARKP